MTTADGEHHVVQRLDLNTGFLVYGVGAALPLGAVDDRPAGATTYRTTRHGDVVRVHRDLAGSPWRVDVAGNRYRRHS